MDKPLAGKVDPLTLEELPSQGARRRLRLLLLLGALVWAGLACSLPALATSTPTSPPPVPAGTPTLPPLSQQALTPAPGLLLRGYVLAADEHGIEKVEILRGFASYPSVVVAVTNAQGYFESSLQPIPGDEMVRVSARLNGVTILPDGPSCSAGESCWRHYYGYEERVLYFHVTAQP